MSSDPTVEQGGQDYLRSQQLSLQGVSPPAQVPGYDLERPLGTGAYGQVWVAVQRNTGRRVAIKFYSHCGGLDWSLLSREVEKLTFLFADRYVVQLIGVGWDAEPPYYVMEYLERGSLAERLQQGPLPVAEAVEIFHDVAMGLAHAHTKGVLHCDLKPANILLDQDHKPRLADFGQSRLSHEQAPALGTLFYMAPEQADLRALPDARWDVYALGAVLYCMLTGQPPHRDDASAQQLDQAADIRGRLAQYRRLLRHSPAPAEHRKVPGVDRDLAEMIDNCLAVNPEERLPSVQAVLDALTARAARRARRPMVILGAIGPVLLLSVVALMAWWGFRGVLDESERALSERAIQSNRFAADSVAKDAGNQLEARWRSIERVSTSDSMQALLKETMADGEFQRLCAELADPRKTDEQLQPLRVEFRSHPVRRRIQQKFAELVSTRADWQSALWHMCDTRGVQLARIPEEGGRQTIGRCFAYRAYFHGLGEDRPEDFRPKPEEHIQDTVVGRVYRGGGFGNWMVPSTTPILEDDEPDGTFMGIVGVSVEVGCVVRIEGSDQRFSALADLRPGRTHGTILSHPLLEQLARKPEGIPDRLFEPPCRLAGAPSTAVGEFYRDPLANDRLGRAFDRRWLAASMPVLARKQDTGWMVVVQEDYDATIGSPLNRIRVGLVLYALLALAAIGLLMVGLWALALRVLSESSARRRVHLAGPPLDSSSTGSGGGTPPAPSAPQNPTQTLAQE